MFAATYSSHVSFFRKSLYFRLSLGLFPSSRTNNFHHAAKLARMAAHRVDYGVHSYLHSDSCDAPLGRDDREAQILCR